MNKEKKIKKILITGINGSGGSYLGEYIIKNKKSIKVYGISRWHSTTANNNISNIKDKINVYECDLNDLSSILTVLKNINPDVIFHLAAHANVRASFDTPSAVLSNNILGTLNLLESIRLLKYDPIIQICSTSEVYGQVSPRDVPIKETTPFKPASPYAVSKIAQDLLGRTYFTSYKMKIVITRMFAYFNPRRTDLFASSFAKQIAWIEQGWQKDLVHGNLDSIRTMIDVRDAMRAYWEAIIHCKYGEAYNIGGTTSIKVSEFLEKLISMSKCRIKTKIDPKLFRPADVTLQIPCVDKFTQATGFQPQYSFEESLENLLNYWRREAEIEKIKINRN